MHNTARVPPTACSGRGDKAFLKGQRNKTLDNWIPQHPKTDACLDLLIPRGLLTVPPAGSCHSNLDSTMCPDPSQAGPRTAQLGDRHCHWQHRVLRPWEWVWCCCGPSAEAPCEVHMVWENPLSVLRWLSHRGAGARDELHTGDPAVAQVCQSLGWG